MPESIALAVSPPIAAPAVLPRMTPSGPANVPRKNPTIPQRWPLSLFPRQRFLDVDFSLIIAIYKSCVFKIDQLTFLIHPQIE